MHCKSPAVSLGSLIFLLYINDLPSQLSLSRFVSVDDVKAESATDGGEMAIFSSSVSMSTQVLLMHTKFTC